MMEAEKKYVKVFNMSFPSVYNNLVAKAERKERSADEVNTIICWLTGYDQKGLDAQLEKNVDNATFYNEAPQINPNAEKITGNICGVRVEEITDPLYQKIRWLDKLIDELARGRAMEKILRA